jgi:hypothetical protein
MWIVSIIKSMNVLSYEKRGVQVGTLGSANRALLHSVRLYRCCAFSHMFVEPWNTEVIGLHAARCLKMCPHVSVECCPCRGCTVGSFHFIEA